MKTKKLVLNVSLSGMFLALAYVMPFLTGQIREIGSMLCPMHIPVLLCGYICGWPWGFAVGFAAPIFRSLILGMPPMVPTAVCMAFELAAYGSTAGLMQKVLPRKKLFVYLSLIVSMIVGRVVWGVSMFLVVGMSGGAFTFSAFLTGAITNAIPGIIVQIIVVPVLVLIFDNMKFLKSRSLNG